MCSENKKSAALSLQSAEWLLTQSLLEHIQVRANKTIFTGKQHRAKGINKKAGGLFIEGPINTIRIIIYTSLLRRLHAQTLPDATPPIGKIHHFSKMVVTFEPLMRFDVLLDL